MEIAQITDNLMTKGPQHVIFMGCLIYFSSVILKGAFPQSKRWKSLIRITKIAHVIGWAKY